MNEEENRRRRMKFHSSFTNMMRSEGEEEIQRYCQQCIDQLTCNDSVNYCSQLIGNSSIENIFNKLSCVGIPSQSLLLRLLKIILFQLKSNVSPERLNITSENIEQLLDMVTGKTYSFNLETTFKQQCVDILLEIPTSYFYLETVLAELGETWCDTYTQRILFKLLIDVDLLHLSEQQIFQIQRILFPDIPDTVSTKSLLPYCKLFLSFEGIGNMLSFPEFQLLLKKIITFSDQFEFTSDYIEQLALLMTEGNKEIAQLCADILLRHKSEWEFDNTLKEFVNDILTNVEQPTLNRMDNERNSPESSPRN